MSRNYNRASINEVLKREGRTLLEIANAGICAGKAIPAVCRYGCKVDLEGMCEHGCPSVLKALMIRGYGWNDIPRGKN